MATATLTRGQKAAATRKANREAANKVTKRDLASMSQLSGCRCGCGGTPKGSTSIYMPGHDNRINPKTGRRYNGR